MVELKYYCDKCKKEMNTSDKRSNVLINDLKVSVLICDECKKELTEKEIVVKIE